MAFIRDDRVAQLDILSVVAIVAFVASLASNCQLRSIIYSTQLPIEDITLVFFPPQTNKEREEETERNIGHLFKD